MLTAYYAFQITYSGFHLGLNTINLGGGEMAPRKN